MPVLVTLVYYLARRERRILPGVSAGTRIIASQGGGGGTLMVVLVVLLIGPGFVLLIGPTALLGNLEVSQNVLGDIVLSEQVSEAGHASHQDPLSVATGRLCLDGLEKALWIAVGVLDDQVIDAPGGPECHSVGNGAGGNQCHKKRGTKKKYNKKGIQNRGRM